VPAAAKPIEQAPELACNELGDWYHGLADQATAPASKGAMLRRAKAYYRQFLDLHKADDLARAGATLMLKKVGDALAKMESKSSPPTLTLDLGKGVTMKLVRIRPGKFVMGEEKDQHEVTLSKPFYVGVTEVTQAQYEVVMEANPSAFRGPTNPVENVSWNDITGFCRRLSERTGRTVRLPTEAEWEYACRAGSRTRFSFGESDGGLAEYAWCSGTGGTHPVARKKPNAWGLYDMHGNVWEWCSDWLGPYAAGRAVDPQGPASGSQHVLRGGAWGDEPQYCRCAHRRSNVPDHRDQFDGFRVVVPVGGVDLK
jgi:formylglycine-generating enzyme required for sulfatase activity